MNIQHVGVGEFGPIYEGLKGKDALGFLLKNKSGEIPGAMYREGLGNIDFVYGSKGKEGYGLAHIEECHPEIFPYIILIIEKGEIFNQAEDRIIIIYKVPAGKGIAVLRLDWNGKRKQWLVSAF